MVSTFNRLRWWVGFENTTFFVVDVLARTGWLLVAVDANIRNVVDENIRIIKTIAKLKYLDGRKKVNVWVWGTTAIFMIFNIFGESLSTLNVSYAICFYQICNPRYVDIGGRHGMHDS